MERNSIGELEELVLLIIGAFGLGAYAKVIREEIISRTGRHLDVTAIHSVLRRLEEKCLVLSFMGGVTKDRGGRSKRIFKLLRSGRSVLDVRVLTRMELYKQLLTAENAVKQG